MAITTNRFTSLDIFRGITICFMIIVNSPGNYNTTFSTLLHAEWHGFTPTDLVFPSFLFAVGNSISYVRSKWKNSSYRNVIFKIFKRTFIIFLIGYLMHWFPFVNYNESNGLFFSPLEETRIFGVLQRIALCYCIASLLIYYFKTKTLFIISIVLLLVYWSLLLFFGDPMDPFTIQGNFGFIVDKWLVGENHMYHGEGVAFDPEGLLGIIPAICNVIAGYLAGKFMQEKGKTYEMLFKLIFVGTCLLVTAYFWNFSFPINKKLWTSSFVLLTIGMDLIIVACIIYIIDFLKVTKWSSFFLIFGRNSLFIYVLSEITIILLIFFKTDTNISSYEWLFNTFFSGFDSHFGSFLFAVSFMFFCWLVGYALDKRKIYIKV